MLGWLKRFFSNPDSGENPGPRRPFVYSNTLPADLGVREELADAVEHLIRKLDDALSETFRHQVWERTLSHHPDISEEKYSWMELEMERFFLLTVLLKHVPMYSDDADLIWHEMLMFTREYQQFCDRFAGFYIHHQPNVNPVSAGSSSEKDERDIFEIVYASLFEVFPENIRLLGPFYRRKMSPVLLEELGSEDMARLRSALRFRDIADPTVNAIQDGIAFAIWEKQSQARAYHDERDSNVQSSYYGGMDPLWTLMAFGMASDLSPFDPAEAERERQWEQYGSSCTSTYADCSGSDSDDGDDDEYDDEHDDEHDDDGYDDDGDSDDSGESSCSSSDDGGSSCSSSSCSSSSGSGD